MMGTSSPPLRLVVLGDSTAFTDHRGPQLPNEPGLYPNVAAAELTERLGREVEVTVIARPGTTVRDAVRTVTKDRHVQFDVLAGADAVVVGVGSFDHAPGGVPAALEAVVPFLHPDGLRRGVRRGLAASYPWLVRASAGRRRRTPASEFTRLYALLLEQLRGLTWGRAAGVAIGPTSHRARYYGHIHPLHARAEAAQLAQARAHGFAALSCWEHVLPHVAALNDDGIHWPTHVHEAVGHALADALADQLTGASPTIGLPAAARAQRGGD